MNILIRIIAGLILGAIVGSLGNNAILAYRDDWPIFPNGGTVLGGGLGAIGCGLNILVRAMVVAFVFGCLAGCMIGVISGHIYGNMKMMEIEPKDGIIQGHFIGIGIAYGVPLGGGIGGLLGLMFYSISAREKNR
jgi:hypothetical protein